MKLRNLKGTIRKTPSVRIAFDTPAGQMLATLVKQDLLNTLDTLYGKDGGVETGLAFTPAGLLTLEGAATPSIQGAATLDWQPTVAAAAGKLATLVARPVLTKEGKLLVGGEIQDIADDLARIAGGTATPVEEIDIDELLDEPFDPADAEQPGSFDDELEGLLS